MACSNSCALRLVVVVFFLLAVQTNASPTGRPCSPNHLDACPRTSRVTSMLQQRIAEERYFIDISEAGDSENDVASAGIDSADDSEVAQELDRMFLETITSLVGLNLTGSSRLTSGIETGHSHLQSKTCLVTCLDDHTVNAYGETLEKVILNRDLYCNATRYTHLVFQPNDINAERVKGRSGHWRKIPAILDAFKKHNCDYAVWLDTDVVVMHATPFDDIYAGLEKEDKFLALARNAARCREVTTDDTSNHGLLCGEWNTGAMVIKRNDESLLMAEQWEAIWAKVHALPRPHLHDQLGLSMMRRDSERIRQSVLVVPRQRLNTFYCPHCDLFVNTYKDEFALHFVDVMAQGGMAGKANAIRTVVDKANQQIKLEMLDRSQ